MGSSFDTAKPKRCGRLRASFRRVIQLGHFHGTPIHGNIGRGGGIGEWLRSLKSRH
jgi:hypothetical protein